MIVYCITNVLNGKRYIGCTSMTLSRRWWHHLSRVQRGCRTALYDAIRKYGKEYFHIEEMVVLAAGSTVQDMFVLERQLIAQECTKAPLGYNLTDGGEGTVGYRYTDAQRAKVRERKYSLETRAKMSMSSKGRRHTEETKRKIGAAAAIRNKGNKYSVGRKMSLESRVKMSIAAKRRWARMDRNPAQSELEIN